MLKFFLIFFIIPFFAFAEQKVITPDDLDSFGWEYVGQDVYVVALLHDTYGCRQPSNKGSVCTNVYYDGKLYDDIIFHKSFKSDDIKPLLSKCLAFIGRVEDRDITTQGNLTSYPALIVSNFKILDDIYCDVANKV